LVSFDLAGQEDGRTTPLAGTDTWLIKRGPTSLDGSNREDRLGNIPRRSVRRTAHDAPTPHLIADAADLAVGGIDLDHVLSRAD
jgi:hypothetical protein